jgi:hypothetical protein
MPARAITASIARRRMIGTSLPSRLVAHTGSEASHSRVIFRVNVSGACHSDPCARNVPNRYYRRCSSSSVSNAQSWSHGDKQQRNIRRAMSVFCGSELRRELDLLRFGGMAIWADEPHLDREHLEALRVR